MIKSAIFLVSLLLVVLTVGCQSQKMTELITFDDNVSLVKDNTGKLYFRSKGSGNCPDDYLYSDTAQDVTHWNDTDIYYEDDVVQNPLNTIVDINSLALAYTITYQYHIEDNNNRYLLLARVCDNTVSYEQK